MFDPIQQSIINAAKERLGAQVVDVLLRCRAYCGLQISDRSPDWEQAKQDMVAIDAVIGL